MIKNPPVKLKQSIAQPVKAQNFSEVVSIWDWSDPINENGISVPGFSYKIRPIKSLKNLCIETLTKNVELLDKMDRYPTDLTRLLLKDCKVDSLYWFERRNETVKKFTDDLWERHYKSRYPRSNAHLKYQATHGWRHCYMFEKKIEAEKAKRFAEKQEAAKEALRNKRQVKVETLTRGHSIFLSPYERSRVEAQALRANPDFERLRRQTLQSSYEIRNGRRPLPTPAGIPMGLTLPIPNSARINSSPSMSPPAIYGNVQRPWSPDTSPPSCESTRFPHSNSQRASKSSNIQTTSRGISSRDSLSSNLDKKEYFKKR